VHSQVTSLTDRLNNTTFKLKEAEAVNQASAKSAPRRSQSVREPPPKEEPEEERREAPPGEAVDYGSPASSVSPSPGDKKAEEPPRESKRGSERPQNHLIHRALQRRRKGIVPGAGDEAVKEARSTRRSTGVYTNRTATSTRGCTYPPLIWAESGTVTDGGSDE
jgi:hypothetical protein